MKTSTTKLHHLLAILICLTLLSSTAMAEGEKDWPVRTKENQPGCLWWWPGSAVDKENITWNMELMKKAGIGGGSIVPIYGVKGAEDRFINFLTPEWLEMMDHAAREAKRLDMWVDMTTGTGWPLGGPSVAKEDSGLVVGYEDGKLTVKPTGFKVKRSAPGGSGLALNPYSKRALDTYLEMFDKALDGKKYEMPRAQYHDSFEYFKTNWADDLLDEFKVRRGYDLNDHLPELFGEGEGDTVARIKSDYRQTLAEMHLRYVETWAAWSASKDCTTRNQAHGAPGNLLDLYAAAGIPETEVFGANKFGIPGLRREEDNVRADMHYPLINHLASSAGHVAGRRLISSETCTWLRNHFRAALSMVKPEIDQLFLSGINHVFYHGNCYSPKDAKWPGWLFYASLEANPRNSFWRDIPALNEYIARCQSVLQSGQPANDVLLYWPIFDIWHKSSGMAEMLTVHKHGWLSETPCGEAAQWMVDNGYMFDFISDDQIAKTRWADGKILAPSGAAYKTILVPKTAHIPVATLRQIIALAEKGATVLFMDQLPKDVPGFADLEKRQNQLRRLTSKLSFKSENDLNLAKTGKGSVAMGAEIKALLEAATVSPEPMTAKGLKTIRRTHEDGLYYFIANLGAETKEYLYFFGTNFKSAQIMDPLTGKTGIARVVPCQGRTCIHLKLAPGETVIVKTFTEKTLRGMPWLHLKDSGNALVVIGEWKVDFVDGGPTLPASFKTSQLKSWTELGDDEARRFAGGARYSIDFFLPDTNAEDWILDLGDVRESARVRINGKDAGTLFAFPYQMRAGKFLKKGKNHLEIEVTNLSANRIRDLDTRKVEWKIFHDINIVNHNYKKIDASKWPLTPSGLLGPVQLIPQKVNNNSLALFRNPE